LLVTRTPTVQTSVTKKQKKENKCRFFLKLASTASSKKTLVGC
jgi:hypothetical protein